MSQMDKKTEDEITMCRLILGLVIKLTGLEERNKEEIGND